MGDGCKRHFVESPTLALTTRAKDYKTRPHTRRLLAGTRPEQAPAEGTPRLQDKCGGSPQPLRWCSHQGNGRQPVVPDTCTLPFCFGVGAANTGDNQWYHASAWETPPMSMGRRSIRYGRKLNERFAQAVLVGSRCGSATRRYLDRSRHGYPRRYQTTCRTLYPLAVTTRIGCVT